MTAIFVLGLASAAAAGPLRTGIVDPGAFGDPRTGERAFARTKAAGGSLAKVLVFWRGAAPRRPENPADPDDPAYSNGFWQNLDFQVTAARRHGLDPILYVQGAPSWAEGSGPGDPGTVRPDPVEFGRFARALATRYSGSFVPNQDPYAEPLPRVRYWQAWNEPNRDYFFMPQYERGRIVSATHYRAMVNRFANAVHAVDPTNVVIAGGLAPIGKPGKPAPLSFMRLFLSAPVEFDVWAHHPYTSGGPTHRATNRNDVSLGDLPKMRALLRSAVRTGRVVAGGAVGFWVTEFSWDSNPPDPRALRSVLHARWTSEALYRMWRNGVSAVVWFKVQDDPLSATAYQSGLYLANGRPKRSLKAFRFPVVGFARRGGVYVWGRTPGGAPGRIAIQIKVGRRWRQLARISANSSGIFSRRLRTRSRASYVRARVGRETSLPFSLRPVGDRYVNPFGCGGGIRC
jgi:hypothetical protein